MAWGTDQVRTEQYILTYDELELFLAVGNMKEAFKAARFLQSLPHNVLCCKFLDISPMNFGNPWPMAMVSTVKWVVKWVDHFTDQATEILLEHITNYNPRNDLGYWWHDPGSCWFMTTLDISGGRDSLRIHCCWPDPVSLHTRHRHQEGQG